jgi:hypothetical protein
MKASSNSGGIKNLLLQHVEKIVLGVAVILVALFLWSALGIKPIDASKAPEKLLAAANTEKDRIQTSEPPKDLGQSGEVNLDNAVAAALQPVAVNHYIHPLKFNPDIQPPIVKRPEPAVLPVEDMRATATVISVPEYGTPPVWKGPEKEKPKGTKKTRPGLDPASQDRLRRRGRGKTGYGAPDQPGYGQTGQPGYGAVPTKPGYGQTAGRGAGADRSAGGQPGYGAVGPTAGYGATSGPPGYGGVTPHGGRGERREGGGYGAVGGYGGVGSYGGAGMPGARPGVDVSSNQQAQGAVSPAVVLTGRVPYEAQFDEFQKKFKGTIPLGTVSTEQDLPQYMQFKVERQEVTPGGDGKWVEVNKDEALKNQLSWSVTAAPDDVDPAYYEQFLTWPLPPTILRNWGRLASHPSIPFVWMAEETAPTVMAPTALDLEQLKQQFTRTIQPQSGFGGYGSAYSDGSRMGAAGYGGVGPGGEQPLVAHTPYFLFRFVDTHNIEPGKEYRYRVSLEVQNPNYLVPAGFLEDPASSQVESRWTAPAESPAITVPGKSFLYALSSKNQNKSPSDFEGQVLFHVWNDKMGAEVAKEFDLSLGAIADFVDTVENWYNPYTGMGEKLENVNFAFKAGPPMLADITGGVEVPGFRDLDKPAEMLFIDAQGRMFTSNQARGAAAAEFYKERYTLEPAPDAQSDQFAPEQPGLQQRGNYGGAR